VLFTALRFRLGFWSLLLSHITFDIPYVVLCILPKLRQLPREVTEAAMDLGATPVHAFFKVVIPEIAPGIFTGLLIAFTLSIDDFVISFFTTGSGVNNLSIVVYSMARRGINPKINAVSTLLFLAVFILLVIINKRDAAVKKLEV
jgi:spermidine/putrescine transport system permease protein